MQLVIEIDEKIYKHYKDLCQSANANQMAEYIQAIGNGVPLPKGHGRLIDADDYENSYKDIIDCEIDHRRYQNTLKELVDSMPTILEADKGAEK